MSAYDERPWTRLYGPDVPADLEPEHVDALAMFRETAATHPDSVAVRYFDGSLTRREVDEASDALAVARQEHGFAPGDRLAVYLQNVPQYLVILLATWKAGGIAVAVNPMNTARELALLLEDSGASGLVCLDTLYDDVAREVVPRTDVRLVVTTTGREHQSRYDARVLPERRAVEGTLDLAALVEEHRGRRPAPVAYGRDDVAVLTYTSGTTGRPKGAMNTHGGIAFTAQVYRDWCRVGPDDVVLGIAPLFHITGLIGHAALAMLVPAPLVLTYRFEPGVVLEAVREHRPTFTVAAITAFTALTGAPGATREDFASLTSVFSGGAAISPATARGFAERFGLHVHNLYGLTETTSPSHATPLGVHGPVDPTSGALSVGLPVPSTVVRISDDEGRDLPVGEVGEIVTEGPQVVPGYWRRPEETERSIPGGRLKTGDVGFMDADGWFFLVDRKKDMINASGYKVWPREVEDVLYDHPAVREAAVVGVPDEYRGETVKAFVSLRTEVAVEELVAHCKERLAAYKYPREIVVLDELPKTVTGKILRRELRG